MSLFGFNSATADDTELYLNQINLPPEQIRPNVVFILDSSGSMGEPVKEYSEDRDDDRWEERYHYDHSRTYTATDNTSGGPGDDDYYYLYERPNTYADQYIYYNKVHKSQMTCDMRMVEDSTPYSGRDEFIFNDGTSNWGHMCPERASWCRFRPAANGALVDCDNEKNHISDDNAYPTRRLTVVSANYHNYLQSYYRYTVLQTVMKDIIDTPYDINMALMKFYGGSGGIVIKEAVDANVQSNQEELKSVINRIHFSGTTPLTESLWEASKYLRGDSAYFGNYGRSVPDAFVSGTNMYDSPIDYACQKSHIILLTDGLAYSDSGRDSVISRLTGNTCEYSGGANTADESCLDDYAGWLHTDEDKPTKRRDHSALTGEQTIDVHTIGFGLTNPLLDATMSNGVGKPTRSYTANTADELAQAFSTILEQIEFEKDTFVAPAVAVNAYNGLQHREELYFALFQPQASPRWAGNIKKFTLDGDTILDRNGNPAIDATTGFFRHDALSYWTTATDLDDGNPGTTDPVGDGGEIALGGMAARLDTPTNRNIYTYTDTADPNDVTLIEQLDVANTQITTTLLGVDGEDDPAAERTAVINWARGFDDGDASAGPNNFVGDFIHNRPAVVTYQTFQPSAQGGRPTFDDTIFSASNMGFLHAIDPDNGEEVFSFVPRALLKNLTTYYQDTGGFTDKVYGLDAPMTVWRFDEDKDGNIVNGTVPDGNDHVYIYQGMRRGGTSIYALDVTRRERPVYKWRIGGTAYAQTPSGDFRDLAQTWSVPQYGKIKWNCSNGNCTDRHVLFFGGGYDIVHDTATSPTTGDKGNALYMVDAETGDLLWSAGNGNYHDNNYSTMNNSFVADVTIGDIDSDGYIDMLFAIDIQGNLWRMDFVDEPSSAATFAQGGKIAELGGSGPNFRRFYNAPDVAYFANRGNKPFLTISVSSGYRSHPRDMTVNDYLFVLFDTNVLSGPSSNNYDYVGGSNPIRFGDLASTATQYGWYKSLNTAGEKGLSRTITFGDQIIMTTYIPDITATCTGTSGGGRYYLLDALNGASLLTDSNDNPLPFEQLRHGGIPPEPAVIYATEDVCTKNCGETTEVTEEKTNLIVCVGTECVDDVVDQQLHKTFWREN